jgi:hypothetical protein
VAFLLALVAVGEVTVWATSAHDALAEDDHTSASAVVYDGWSCSPGPREVTSWVERRKKGFCLEPKVKGGRRSSGRGTTAALGAWR